MVLQYHRSHLVKTLDTSDRAVNNIRYYRMYKATPESPFLLCIGDSFSATTFFFPLSMLAKTVLSPREGHLILLFHRRCR